MLARADDHTARTDTRTLGIFQPHQATILVVHVLVCLGHVLRDLGVLPRALKEQVVAEAALGAAASEGGKGKEGGGREAVGAQEGAV